MAELIGTNVAIKVSGTPVAMIGEPTSSGDNINYQITDTAKQVLDRMATIRVLLKGTNDAAEAGTTTTNLKMTAHGLQTGDVIINTTRSSAKREVTRVDADNVTVSAVTGQTTGDTIEVYLQQTPDKYASLKKIMGKVTFLSATARTVLISGNYLPLSTAAYAISLSRDRGCDLLESTKFGDTNKARVAGLLYGSGTLTHIDVTDTVFDDALVAGTPVVIQNTDAAAADDRVYAMLESVAMQAAVEGLIQKVVGWTSSDAMMTKGA